jgi:adenylate cyclase
LTAIVAADVAGYSRLVALDEEGALRQLGDHLRQVVEPTVAAQGGRIFKTTGDGFLAEFPGSVDAVRCAVAIQDGIAQRNAPVPAEQRLEFRIGVHIAEVVIEDGDILGAGVNIAARLEGLAEPGGVYVSARVQEEAADHLELGFEDLGEQQLKNIPRPVRVYRVLAGAASATPARPNLPRPAKPSIAVIPFRNISGDPEQEYFADALSEDLIIALSRWRWFFVIARDSSFAFKDQTDLQRIGEDLGVRFLLEGSVRKGGSRMRVTAQLVDVASASPVWADAFDRELTDILLLQDEIVQQVVTAIEPTMLSAEGDRVARKNLKDYSAFDCFQRGMWHLNKVSEEGYHEAIPYFREAIARDPELALGYVGLARILYGGAMYGWAKQRRQTFEESLEAAATAIRLDPRDAIAYYAYAGAALHLERYDEALDAARNAVDLNPNFVPGHVRLGQVLAFSGRPAEAVAPIERAIRRNPYDPQQGIMLGTLSLAHYLAGDYVQAVARSKAALARGYRGSLHVTAAALGQLGEALEAERILGREQLIRLVTTLPRLVAREEDRQHVREGLELAARALETEPYEP